MSGDSKAAAPLGSKSDLAASFGVRAMGEANLLDPLGKLMDYEGITQSDGGWLLMFKPFECDRSGGVESCKLVDGSDRVILTVEQAGDVLRVVDVAGTVSETSQAELLRYQEPASLERLALTYPVIRFDKSTEDAERSLGEDAWEVRAVALWTGPVTSAAVTAECSLVAIDDDGNEVASEQLSDVPSPNEESMRSGSELITGFSANGAQVATVQIECTTEGESGSSWALTESPDISIQDNGIRVLAQLQWTSREEPSESDGCTAVAVDAAGNPIGRGSARARVLPDADRSVRPLPGAALIPVRVTDMSRFDHAEVVC
jgi:hypothetical protein